MALTAISGRCCDRGHTVIGDNCVVKGHSSIKRSIIWKSAVIGEKAELRGCVVCGRAIVESGASAFEGSVVGEGSVSVKGRS